MDYISREEPQEDYTYSYIKTFLSEPLISICNCSTSSNRFPLTFFFPLFFMHLYLLK